MTETNECAFDGCTRPVRVRKHRLCVAHYQQLRAGKELAPVHKYSARQDPDAAIRECTLCHRMKPRTDFYLRPRSSKPHAQCKVCMTFHARVRYLVSHNRQDDADAELRRLEAYIAGDYNV